MPHELNHHPADEILPFSRYAQSAPVLVTGASGFLGREVVRQFSEAGVTVKALARAWPSEPTMSSHVERHVGDITDPESIAAAVAGTRTIVHCAGLAHQFGKTSTHAEAFQRVNVQGTETVARLAAKAGVAHLVLVSSVSVYGGGTQPTDESTPCRPTEPYGLSKLQAEQVAIEISAAAGMRLTILRMATIIGEGDPGNIGRLMRAIDRGRFVWLGAGANRKSLIYRGDAARACVVAALSSRSAHDGKLTGRAYNISLPAVPVARIVAALATGLGRVTPRWYIPAPIITTVGGGLAVCMGGRGPVARIHRTIGKWLSDDIYLGEQFARDHEFHPEVSVDEGLWREAAWYRHSKAA